MEGLMPHKEPLSKFDREYRRYVAELAALRRRWFANPPEGFEVPSAPILANVSTMARHLFGRTEEGTVFEHKLAGMPENAQTLQILQISTIQHWLKANGPTFFIPPDLADAISNTDALGSVQGSDVKVVYPCGYISLPKSRHYVSKVTGDTLGHVWFRFVDTIDTAGVWLNGKHKTTFRSGGPRLVMIGFWNKLNDASSFVLQLDAPGPLNAVIEKSSKKIREDETRDVAQRRSEEIETEDFGEWVASLCVNLCLIMQSYPQYIRPDPLAHRQTYGKGKVKPLIAQIVRSRVADIRQIVHEGEHPDSNPTGRVTRAHWRKGHWRRQNHGDAWELTFPDAKVIISESGHKCHMKWIEPVFVNLEKEAADAKQGS